MSYAADLHLHSRYAYATSKNIILESLAAWARVKGIDLLSSADFTHPVWRRELEDKLVPVSPGLYRFGGVSFVLGTEVSCVYKQGGRSSSLPASPPWTGSEPLFPMQGLSWNQMDGQPCVCQPGT